MPHSPSPFDPDGRLAFDEPTHAYTLDGWRPLPSVTTIIRTAFEGACGEAWWNESARQRGTAVHAAIALHDEGTLDRDSIHEVVAPYFAQYLDFARVCEPLWIHTEQKVFDPDLGYAGQFDAFGMLNGPHKTGLANVFDLLDWKSGYLPWSVGLQTAAYAMAVRRIKDYKGVVIRRWALQLTPEKWNLECVSSWPDAREHEPDFKAAIRVARRKAASNG